ncbi:LysR family transcriptional regulator [Streptococcus panodentis]|nr:LysR family transcriptional regulator [Streptococcus panodentis]
MNPYLLEQLLAFYRTGTLSAAAEALFISQPALSQSMKKIEEIAGVPLFIRQKNKTVFNENGRLMAEYAEKILSLQEEMLAAVRYQASHQKSLRIGSIAPGPLLLLEPQLAQIQPSLELMTDLLSDEEDLTGGLEQGRYDWIVTRQPYEHAGWICLPYLTERLSMRIPKQHPLAKKERLTFADLARQNILLLSELGFWTDLVKEQIPTANFLYIDSRHAFSEIASMGTFPTFVSDLFTAKQEAADSVILPLQEDLATARFYLLLKEDQLGKWEGLLRQVRSGRS